MAGVTAGQVPPTGVFRIDRTALIVGVSRLVLAIRVWDADEPMTVTLLEALGCDVRSTTFVQIA